MAITINGTANTVAGVAAGGINDNVVDNGTMADDAIGIAELSATGTASSSTYLRGDNSWATPSGGIAATHDGVVKVWCNFNGTGTIAIRDHYNVSSLTDNHTGTYTVNFDTDFASVNYAAVVSGGHSGNSSAPRGFETVYNMAVGSVKMDFRDDLGAEADPQVVSVICIGDQ